MGIEILVLGAVLNSTDAAARICEDCGRDVGNGELIMIMHRLPMKKICRSCWVEQLYGPTEAKKRNEMSGAL